MNTHLTSSVIFVLSAIFLLSSLSGIARSDGLIPVLEKGDIAPSFRLTTPSGEKVAFQPGKKKAILVFWSAFCPVCREIIPDINEVYDMHKREINILSVNVDGERFSNAVDYFLEEMHVRFPVAFDVIVNDLLTAADAYGVKTTPTIFFISREGKIVEVIEGEKGREFRGRAKTVLSPSKK